VGEEAQVVTLKNGALYDTRLKRIVGNVGGLPATAFTAETGRLANLRGALKRKIRRERVSQKTRKRLLQMVKDWAPTEDQPVDSEDAYAMLLAELGKGALANALERPHDAARAARFVGETADLIERANEKQDAGTTVQTLIITAGPELAALDAEWKDSPTT